jgi:hypothetical protein
MSKPNDGADVGGVVQRVFREVGGGSSYPTLTKTNYSDWALLMKVKLKARGLWSVVQKKSGDEMEEMMALDVLASAVPPEMVATVASKDSAKEAWEEIRTLRVGDERVRAATAQQLLRRFENAAIKEEESIEDYSLRLSGMVQQLATLGKQVEEPKVVGKFLRSMPHRYRQIVVAIQSLLDVDTLTLANVIGRLKAAEEEFEAPPSSVSHAGKLYLLEEAWEERRKQRDGKKPTGGGPGGRGSGGRGGRSNRGRGHGGGGRDSNGSSSSGPAKLGKDQCKHCFKFGHWGRECPNRPRKEAANVVQEEEEALMMVRVAESTITSPDRSPPQNPSSDRVGGAAKDGRIRGSAGSDVERRRQPVHLYEQKVFVQLGAKEDQDTKIWICDTGATNHMCGSRAAFANLDEAIRGTVRFGDDSMVQIEGR